MVRAQFLWRFEKATASPIDVEVDSIFNIRAPLKDLTLECEAGNRRAAEEQKAKDGRARLMRRC
jgi:hypothetical protein